MRNVDTIYVVTWGSPLYGGDSSAVEAELKEWMNERDIFQSFLDSIYARAPSIFG
jgi:hypothetical protein